MFCMRMAAGSRGQHHARTSDRIVTLSGIPTQPCTLPWGDHFVSLATQNKQDWARLHGYEFHVMAASCDVRIRPGPWQKIAMIRQVCSPASHMPSLLHGTPAGAMRNVSANVCLGLQLTLILTNIADMKWVVCAP